MEHFDLMTRSFPIVQHQPRSNDIERCINVKWIWIIKRELVDTIAPLTEMTAHPFNPKVISYLRIKRGPNLFHVADQCGD